jgi:EAL domain-containing protein (putative c-di-GMP-specific phosphodiesterase class I)
VAEAHGRVGVIDRWVLSTVLEWLDTHHAQLTGTRFVTVNFSGASINDEQFMADAYAMLRAHPRAAARLCAEITEGVALRDFDQTRRVLERLREFDVKLALDDFGAGYTSFMYLSDLQADVIKIDGAIVESAARHPSRLSIVQAIADLSRNLGMRSIAEWVEDAATLRANGRRRHRLHPGLRHRPPHGAARKSCWARTPRTGSPTARYAPCWPTSRLTQWRSTTAQPIPPERTCINLRQ